MKVAVDMGHCPKSTGAVGYLNELDEDRKIGRALIAELKARGHGVVDVTPADSAAESLSGRAQRVNAAGADFFASIHLNAGGGTGTEVHHQRRREGAGCGYQRGGRGGFGLEEPRAQDGELHRIGEDQHARHARGGVLRGHLEGRRSLPRNDPREDRSGHRRRHPRRI